MRKICIVILALFIVPLDFIGWNIMFGAEYGYVTPKKSFEDCYAKLEGP